MSRSYRHTKIFSNASPEPGSQKQFRRSEHQAERSKVRTVLKHCRDYDSLVLPSPKEYGNEWASPRDGRHYWKDAQEKDMRK